MGNGPNFEAYKRYQDDDTQQGVAVFDGGLPGTADDYVIIDYQDIRESTIPAQTLVDRFKAVAGERFDNPYSGLTSDEVLSVEAIEAARNGESMLIESGGGNVYESERVLRIDTQTSTLQEFAADIVGQRLPDNVFTPEEEALFARFTEEHEKAHLFLDLDEAGSDYVASVRLLQENPGPETQAFLQKVADLREVAPYRAIPTVAGETALKYGYGCTTAIEATIHSHDDLTELSIEQIYDNATTYDALNGRPEGGVGSMRPEMTVRLAMLEQNPDLLRGNFNEGRVSETAQQLLNDEKFEPGSKEIEILEELVEASERIENSYGGIEETPTPIPSLEAAISAHNNDTTDPNIGNGPG